MSLQSWSLRSVLFAISVSVISSAAARAAEPAFVFEDITRSANGNRQIGLKRTADGRVHVAYTGCSDPKCKNDELFYSVRSPEGAWTSASVDNDHNATGWSVSMVIDETDSMHLFYSTHYNLPQLRHAFKRLGSSAPGEGWGKELVGTFGGGYWTSTASVPGTLYVANTAFPTNDIRKPALQLATLDTAKGTWAFEEVDKSFEAGWFTSLALSAEGLPVVSYTQGGYPKGELRLARKLADGTWNVETIDYETIKSSVAVDRLGFIHIAYTRVDPEFMAPRDLYYATNFPDGKWHRTKVDGGQHEKQDTGLFPNLKIDSSGGLHIVYNDNFHAKVMYARNLGDGWKTYEVTRNRQDGYYAAVDLDAAGGLHFAYDAGYQLRYVYCADCAKH